MAVKSLDELRALREQHKGQVSLRHDENGGEHIEILVGMGTCGIAAGARETLRELTQEVNQRNLDRVRVIPVGCIGYCNLEPIVIVHMPNEKPCPYGHVTKDQVRLLIQSHIEEGNPVESMKIGIDFDGI